MTTMTLGEKLVLEFKQVQAERGVWEDHWQVVGELVHGNKQNFTEENVSGERLNDERHDSTAVFANRSLASALIGMLWPNGAKSMRLMKARGLSDSQENKDYFDAVTDIMRDAMDDPLAGLNIALDEYMLDQGAFGTSGLGVFAGSESDLRFESWGTVQLFIREGEHNQVNQEFRFFNWPLAKVIATYGLENLSDKLQKKAENIKNHSEKIKLLHVIKPRDFLDERLSGNRGMPFMSVHIEFNGAHVIKESGFDENPVKVGRFRKLPYETYGRSPGMDGLSEVLELDYLRERFTINVDKSGDPPLMVLDDGRFGGGIIDTSAGAINVIDVSGRIPNNVDPIKPLQTVGELNTTLTRIEQLKSDIAQHFFLDKLLDFNNEVEMTASEALLRDRIRGAALGSIFARQVTEVFDPIISRSFNLLLKMGRLGVVAGSEEERAARLRGEEPLIIPDEIARRMAMPGANVFSIKYFTPAARMLRLQEAEAINQLTAYKQQLQATNEQAGDLFNDDEAVKEMANITGVPANILFSQEEADGVRDARAQMREAEMTAQLAQQAGAAAKDFSQAGVAIQ